MKDVLVKKSMIFIDKNTNFSKERLEVINYGLQGLYSTLIKIIVSFIISIILGITNELLLFLLFYIPLRTFSGGFHAKSNIECWLISLPSFIVFPLIIKYNLISNSILISLIILTIPFLIVLSPADTIKKPMIRRNIRIRNKIIIIIVTISYVLILLLSNIHSITSSIILAITWQTIIINPVFYQLFKQPYKNYRNYKI